MMHGTFSWKLLVAFFVLNLQAVVQAAAFFDPSLPAVQEFGRIAEALLRVLGWACVLTVAVDVLPARVRQKMMP